MKFLDILTMSIGNLRRRKLRTFLTVLGVLIGTTSVVIMLSLGLGLKESMMKQMSSYGAMSDLDVMYQGEDKNRYITDSLVEEFEDLEFVDYISPELMTAITMTQGRWTAFVTLTGLNERDMAQIPVGEGRLPSADSDTLELIVGNMVIEDVYNSVTGEYPYYSDNEYADMDFMGDVVMTEFFDYDNVAVDDNGNLVTKNKKSTYPIVGMVEGDRTTYNKYSYGVYTDMDMLKFYLKKVYKGKVVFGQPTDKNGRALKEWTYTKIVVHLNSAEDVEYAKSYFQELGYEVSSQTEWMEQVEDTMAIVQIVLGAIGSIALIVAAIGIANTMTMSTYERTKEIGVMKVLGCRLSNIRTMFLTEAACIGFIGGAGGLLLSELISLIANKVAGPILSNAMQVGNLTLSVIPIWLVVLALIFASLVGMLAGYFPAVRAMKLSPLAAIRND